MSIAPGRKTNDRIERVAIDERYEQVVMEVVVVSDTGWMM